MGQLLARVHEVGGGVAVNGSRGARLAPAGTHARKAALTCSACGFEREVEGDAVTLLTASAVSREMLDETLPLGAVEGDTRGTRPVGTEWLIVDQPPLLLSDGR